MDWLEPVDIDSPEFADLYDELPLWSAPFGLWLLERCPLAPGLTTLDIGAGTGFITLELAERGGASCSVIAVDPWAAAIARLRRKVAQRRLSNVHLLQQDAAQLALPERSVDVIVSNLGVNNFDDPAAVMRVCARVARPGAHFLLTSNLVGHMAEFYAVFDQVLAAAGLSEPRAALQRHVQHRATPAGLQGLLADAGFETQERAEWSFTMRFADGAALLRHHFIRLGFLPGWKQIVPEGQREAIFMALQQALDAEALRQGGLCLTIPAAGIVARRTRNLDD